MKISKTFIAAACASFVLAAVASSSLSAQSTFTSNPNAAIPDNNAAGVTDTIAVTGMTGPIDSLRVDVRIDHTWDGDLELYLIPAGQTWAGPYTGTPPAGIVHLSSTNGGSSDDYGSGASSPFTYSQWSSGTDPLTPGTVGIAAGAAPFTAAVYTVEAVSTATFDAIYGTTNHNGNWTLAVSDNAGADVGTILSWQVAIRTTTPTPPTITSSPAPSTAFSGSPYSYTVTANGTAPITFSISPDPATLGTGWLTWDGTDTLSGTPAAGDIGVDIGPLTITATNGVNPDATEVITVSVSAPAPEIDVVDPNTNSVASGATLNVYAALVGVSSTGTFTINNSGSNALALSGTPIVDKGTSENNCTVTITQPTLTSLPATTGTDTFGVDVNPTAIGAFSFSLTILNDDTDEGTYVINFSGVATTAAEAEIAVWDPNSANVANNGSFAESNTGVAVFNRTFTIRNEGGATLNLNGTTPIVVSGEANCTVGITQPANTVGVATTWVAGSDTVVFAITPTAAGAFSFVVTIANNDGDEAPFVFTFSGNTAAASSGGGGGSDSSCSTGSTSGYSWMALLGLLSALVVFTRVRGSKA